MLVAGAVMIGKVVGEEKWAYLAAIAALPLIASWPVHIALGAFAFLVPFDEVAVVSAANGGTTLTWFVGIAAALILLVAGFASRRIQAPPRATLWWSLFVLWGAASYAWAVDPAAAYYRLPTASSLLLLYVLSVSLRIKANERFWIVVLSVLGGCFAAAYGATEFYQGVSYRATGRASLIFGNQQADPNGLAASLLLPISLAIALFFSSQKWTAKVMSLTAVSVIGFCILLTMSRGSALALITIGLVYLCRLKKWRALIPLLLLVPLLLFIPDSLLQRFAEAVPTGGAGRVGIWTVGLVLLKHYGILGAGLNNFPGAYTAYAGSGTIFTGFARGAHNIYLGTWVELGVVGLILFLLAAKSQLQEVWHARVEFDPILVGLEAACWAILICGFFLDVMWRKYFWLSWILLAISAQISRKSQLEPR